MGWDYHQGAVRMVQHGMGDVSQRIPERVCRPTGTDHEQIRIGGRVDQGTGWGMGLYQFSGHGQIGELVSHERATTRVMELACSSATSVRSASIGTMLPAYW